MQITIKDVLSTQVHYLHLKYEYIPIGFMEKAVKFIITIIEFYSNP